MSRKMRKVNICESPTLKDTLLKEARVFRETFFRPLIAKKSFTTAERVCGFH